MVVSACNLVRKGPKLREFSRGWAVGPRPLPFVVISSRPCARTFSVSRFAHSYDGTQHPLNNECFRRRGRRLELLRFPAHSKDPTTRKLRFSAILALGPAPKASPQSQIISVSTVLDHPLPPPTHPPFLEPVPHLHSCSNTVLQLQVVKTFGFRFFLRPKGRFLIPNAQNASPWSPFLPVQAGLSNEAGAVSWQFQGVQPLRKVKTRCPGWKLTL